MTYRFSSHNMLFDSEALAIPSVRLLGLLPSDLKLFKIPASAYIVMTQREQDKAKSLLTSACIADLPEWKEEIDLLIKGNRKVDLHAIGNHKDVANYLRWKLVTGSYK